MSGGGAHGWWAAEQQRCNMCHDAFDRVVVTFKYADDFHGPHVIQEGRVGAAFPSMAHNSTFLHPVVQFFPKARADAQDAPPSEVHLVEDVQALWDVADMHLNPLRR